MKIWEWANNVDDFAALVVADQNDVDAKTFLTNGMPKSWSHPPRIEVFVEKRRKKPQPRADLSSLMVGGAMVLNSRARDVLGDFLAPFGQLLQVDCDGHPEWFFNVTQMIDCIDFERSKKMEAAQVVTQEVFRADAVPSTPQVFKDPLTAKTRIYVNEAAKDVLQALFSQAGLTGSDFREPGWAYAG